MLLGSFAEPLIFLPAIYKDAGCALCGPWRTLRVLCVLIFCRQNWNRKERKEFAKDQISNLRQFTTAVFTQTT
ncbi:MAG TPA: hypothetical protein DCK93_01615, partial [Blastocatellia bacterium]|nr:hypothetical protein [Blastocatellia bacterium]